MSPLHDESYGYIEKVEAKEQFEELGFKIFNYTGPNGGTNYSTGRSYEGSHNINISATQLEDAADDGNREYYSQ
jgi:hypothetical protein